MDHLYMDEGAISHASPAGGTSLLDKYAQLADAKGLRSSPSPMSCGMNFSRARENAARRLRVNQARALWRWKSGCPQMPSSW